MAQSAFWITTSLALLAATNAAAQAPSPAEVAAQQAEQAAIAAEQALNVATAAAKAARAAAEAAKVSAQGPLPPAVMAPPPAAQRGGLVVPASARAWASASRQAAFQSALASGVANGPNDGFLKTGRGPDFQLLASEKEKVASVALSFSTHEPTGTTLSSSQFNVTVSGKLDDDGGADLVGLKGFTNGTEVELGWTFFSSNMVVTGNVPQQVLDAERNCLALLGAADPKTCVADEYASGVSMFVAKYNRDGLNDLIDTVAPGNVAFGGFKVSGNQATYKFLDRAKFAMDSEDHFGFGGSVFGGLLVNRGLTSFTGAFTYKRAYNEQGSIELCQPVAGTVQVQCLTGKDGRPDRESRAIFTVDVRHIFGVTPGKYGRFAVGPEFSYDANHDAYSVSVPLYFASDGAGKLRAGLRAVYLNEKDKVKGGRNEDVTVGLFFGAPFSVFTQ